MSAAHDRAVTELLAALDAAGVRGHDLIDYASTPDESRTRVEFDLSGTLLHVLVISGRGRVLVLTESGYVGTSASAVLERARDLVAAPGAALAPDATNAALRRLAVARTRATEEVVTRFLDAARAEESAPSPSYPMSTLLRSDGAVSAVAGPVDLATTVLEALADGAPLAWVLRLYRARS